MNTRVKLCIPLIIIIVTLTGALLAGGVKGGSQKEAEVFAQFVTKEEVLTMIDRNMSNTPNIDKVLILSEIEDHMLKFDKGKNHDFKVILDDNMKDLQEIMEIEQKVNFHEMSLDARLTAMRLLSKICEEYGIDITYDLKGDIVRIVNFTGKGIYETELIKEKQKMQVEVFVLILLVILCFIIVCIYITKKKQLILKDGIYDGYNKKGFA